MASTQSRKPSAQLRLMGADLDVPLVGGGRRRYLNLDFAASAPALEAAVRALESVLPWYSSVHRGAGFKSQVSTAAYEGAREELRLFFGARDDDAVVFTRNTTDAINLLSYALPPETDVIAFAVDHHANMLPWRSHSVRYLPVPSSPEALISSLEQALAERTLERALVTVTGASNVTGEIWPLAEIVQRAHAAGARVLVDAAQLAPHYPIDLSALGVDYLAISGHKMYAPFGSGALIGRADWLEDHEPLLRGGGAVDFVTLDDVAWKEAPDRQEAGSPNILGAIALGAACRALREYGMDALAEEEAELYSYARERILTVRGLELYTVWGSEYPHVGILTFNLRGYEHSLLAAILSAEYGIGVRHGCFCAHPLLLHLLRVERSQADLIRDELRSGVRPSMPGAVRMSLGLGVTKADIDETFAALRCIAENGPCWRYERDSRTGEYEPVDDPRAWPDLPVRLSRHHAHGIGESS
ncbi:MAG TPA: aminotransferase class V-fold PLP-dependent enzyme [Candidatus Dormibacteraeota bacterium]|nr:aminotransferase class V-fold PLP-dependent enzyme [Candidatus Dormibacteraeota bacterium]